LSSSLLSHLIISTSLPGRYLICFKLVLQPYARYRYPLYFQEFYIAGFHLFFWSKVSFSYLEGISNALLKDWADSVFYHTSMSQAEMN